MGPFLPGSEGEAELLAAFGRFARLLDAEDPAVRVAFGWFLTDAPRLPPEPAADRALVRALDEAWIAPENLALPVVRYLARKWPRALGVSAPGEPQLAALLRDPLLLALMRATPAATPGVDMLLARFRHFALRAALARQDLGGFLPTVAALAVRGWHSHYALTLPATDRDAAARAAEPALAARLRAELDGDRLGAERLAAALVLACYEPPAAGEFARCGADPLARLVEEAVVAPRERQRAIAAALPCVTPLHPSSEVVAAQYEAHPYPAWAKVAGDLPEVPAAVLRALRVDVEPVRSVLVAGCGTGRHAVDAARTWPAAEVLALDLSRTSLAYAVERTSSAGLDRLRFAQGDLLELGALRRRFRVIEAFGVLHHLADPAAGLLALREALAPGGVIGLGLYAAAARTGLADFRRRYGARGASDEEIRDFRAWALVRERDSPFLLSPDFYSIGGCRDAFFHVRERGYALDEVAELLDRARLRLVALQTPPEARHLPDPLPAADDLPGWTTAERRHPDLFVSMYEIWAQDAA